MALRLEGTTELDGPKLAREVEQRRMRLGFATVRLIVLMVLPLCLKVNVADPALYAVTSFVSAEDPVALATEVLLDVTVTLFRAPSDR